jgi:hypothetical protein
MEHERQVDGVGEMRLEWEVLFRKLEIQSPLE